MDFGGDVDEAALWSGPGPGLLKSRAPLGMLRAPAWGEPRPRPDAGTRPTEGMEMNPPTGADLQAVSVKWTLFILL